jgi:alpha-L-arabinofuranosidase
MSTFGSWEATVLERAYDDVDFISADAYYENQGDLASSSPPRSTWRSSSPTSSTPPTTSGHD